MTAVVANHERIRLPQSILKSRLDCAQQKKLIIMFSSDDFGTERDPRPEKSAPRLSLCREKGNFVAKRTI